MTRHCYSSWVRKFPNFLLLQHNRTIGSNWHLGMSRSALEKPFFARSAVKICELVYTCIGKSIRITLPDIFAQWFYIRYSVSREFAVGKDFKCHYPGKKTVFCSKCCTNLRISLDMHWEIDPYHPSGHFCSMVPYPILNIQGVCSHDTFLSTPCKAKTVFWPKCCENLRICLDMHQQIDPHHHCGHFCNRNPGLKLKCEGVKALPPVVPGCRSGTACAKLSPDQAPHHVC